jgi:hypothetical protein
MDPYLEDVDVFPSLHANLITYLQELLQPQLPEPYFAKTNERVWMEVTARYIEPDVDVFVAARRPKRGRSTGGGVAVASPRRRQPVVVCVPQDEHRQTWVNIWTRRGSSKRLVTTIEILSPSNKTPGQQGRGLYLKKQREILESQVHLVEIDLLRGGEHTTSVPQDRAIATAGPCDYHVCIRRFDRVEEFLVYPIPLREPLPEIAIPLLPGDGEVRLDLQVAFKRAYDAGPYRREIDYAKDKIVPALQPPSAKWAKSLVAGQKPGGPGTARG